MRLGVLRLGPIAIAVSRRFLETRKFYRDHRSYRRVIPGLFRRTR